MFYKYTISNSENPSLFLAAAATWQKHFARNMKLHQQTIENFHVSSAGLFRHSILFFYTVINTVIKNGEINPIPPTVSLIILSVFNYTRHECRTYLSPISQLYISSYCCAECPHEKSAAIARSTILFHSRLLS